MIAPSTILGHGLLGLFCLAIVLYSEVFFKERTHKSPLSHDLGRFFLFYLFYNISLIIPLIFSLSQFFINLGFSFGLFLLFLGLSYLVRIPIALLFPKYNFLKNIFSGLFIACSIAILAFGLYFPGAHVLDGSQKLMIWRASIIPKFFSQFGPSLAALMFALAFLKGALKTKESIFVKIRSAFFALSAFVFSFSSPVYYAGTSERNIILGLVFGLSGGTIAVLGIVIFGIFKFYHKEKIAGGSMMG